MLKKFAFLYESKNIKIVPIIPKTKRPALKEWVTHNLSAHELVHQFSECDLGVVLGHYSNLICLDIDTLDKDLQKIIDDYLSNYPTPIMRMGNKNKLPARFYQYNNESKITIKRNNETQIELLTTGQQVVIPPSKYNDEYNYEWIGIDLLYFELDFLPSLPNNVMIDLEKIVNDFYSDKPKTQNKLSTGRHNKLVEIASAMIGRNEPLNKILNEIIEYDNANHEPPYFTDKTELHKGLGKESAQKMIMSLIQTINKKGITYWPDDTEIKFVVDEPEINKAENILFEKQVIPKWTGIGHEIFQHIYHSSPIPRSRFAWAATLSILGATFSNCIRKGKLGTNFYLLLVGGSSSGKNNPLRAADNIFLECDRHDLIGDGKPRSSVGMIMNLENQRSRLDTMDEVKDLFSGMIKKDSYLNGVSEMYSELFYAPNTLFKGNVTRSESKNGKRGVVGRCYSPCLSFISAITDDAFRKSFSETFINEGLGSRIIYFWDLERKDKNYDFKNISDVPKEIRDFLAHWKKIKPDHFFDGVNIILDSSKKFNIPEIKVSKETQKYLTDIKKQIDKDMTELTKINGGSYKNPRLERSGEMIEKLAIVAACSNRYMSLDQSYIEMSINDISWANESIKKINQEADYYLSLNVQSDSMQYRSIQEIKRIIAMNNGKIKSGDLLRKSKMTAIQLKPIIDTLELTHEIKKVPTGKQGGGFWIAF